LTKIFLIQIRHSSHIIFQNQLCILPQVILAKSFAPNIRVNAIGPGPTIKNIHQSKKHFEKSVKSTPLKIGSPPSEIVKSVIFLLESKAITGQFITVDGGEHLK
jgi:NAD(P)-dependent dehydrogenase (short-subunit alcohol dehydrogenase family)